jgi:hypothetical protein
MALAAFGYEKVFYDMLITQQNHIQCDWDITTSGIAN